ncbi:MAG: VanZ family protein [Candidatus Bruticola sp.]
MLPMRRLVLAAWMALIFCASADSVSGERSWALVEYFIKLTELIGLEVSAQFNWPFFHFCLRKLAHLTEYAILYSLWRWNSLKSGSSLVAVCLCACLDEWHQSFVACRIGCVTDIFIDLSGALAAWGTEKGLGVFFAKLGRNGPLLENAHGLALDKN